MIRFSILYAALFCLCSCQELDRFFPKEEKEATKETYSYACLDSAVSGARIGRTLNKAGEAIRDFAVSEEKITDELQSEYGAAFHKQMIAEKTFVLLNDAQVNARLNSALKALLTARPVPSKIQYAIYALADTAINAFTFGGRIYVTKGMLQEVGGSNALLYAIIGHEIGHSEEGHIKKAIQELQLTTNIFGEANAGTVLQITKMLTASFNQRNELEADYYGIELTHALKQDLCSAVKFWRTMSDKENSYNKVEDFFRTHPFSSLRAQCLQDHIMSRFAVSCGGIDAADTHPQLLTDSAKVQ